MEITINLHNVPDDFYKKLWDYCTIIAKDDFSTFQEPGFTQDFDINYPKSRETEMDGFMLDMSGEILASAVSVHFSNHQTNIK